MYQDPRIKSSKLILLLKWFYDLTTMFVLSRIRIRWDWLLAQLSSSRLRASTLKFAGMYFASKQYLLMKYNDAVQSEQSALWWTLLNAFSEFSVHFHEFIWSPRSRDPWWLLIFVWLIPCLVAGSEQWGTGGSGGRGTPPMTLGAGVGFSSQWSRSPHHGHPDMVIQSEVLTLNLWTVKFNDLT